MEKNHVVVDLDTFLKLQKDSEELNQLKETSIVLTKNTFKLETDYFSDKVLLKMDGEAAATIAEDLFVNSEFQDEFLKDFSKEDLSKVVTIGEYELVFKKVKNESGDNE